MNAGHDRRTVLAAACGLGAASLLTRPAGAAADYRFRQFHNQTAASPLHRRLAQMWATVRLETGGRVETEVYPENAGIAGSDPGALKMLIAGELEFFTLMGGVLGQVVPVAEVQQTPFAFRSAGEAHAAVDGALGDYLRAEMEAKGIHGFKGGVFDNGMRQTSCSLRPILSPTDFEGIRIRLPAGELFTDTFRALGAEPVTINVNQLYEALQSRRADAQENPLAVTEVFKLYEVQKYMAMTNHMWSGFNLLANLAVWRRLPEDIRGVVERNVVRHARLQRQDQALFNGGLRRRLAGRGMLFNEIDRAAFRRRMTPVYATWKNRFGARCWELLEAQVGRLA